MLAADPQTTPPRNNGTAPFITKIVSRTLSASPLGRRSTEGYIHREYDRPADTKGAVENNTCSRKDPRANCDNRIRHKKPASYPNKTTSRSIDHSIHWPGGTSYGNF